VKSRESCVFFTSSRLHPSYSLVIDKIMFLRPVLHRQKALVLASTRYMSMSTATTPRRFILYAPDNTEEGTVALRMSKRPDHLAVANELITNGTIKVGGAMLDSESADQKMVGSMIIYEADSLDAVKELVENDIYYKSGVWDTKNLVILPFKALKI